MLPLTTKHFTLGSRHFGKKPLKKKPDTFQDLSKEIQSEIDKGNIISSKVIALSNQIIIRNNGGMSNCRIYSNPDLPEGSIVLVMNGTFTNCYVGPNEYEDE